MEKLPLLSALAFIGAASGFGVLALIENNEVGIAQDAAIVSIQRGDTIQAQKFRDDANKAIDRRNNDTVAFVGFFVAGALFGINAAEDLGRAND